MAVWGGMLEAEVRESAKFCIFPADGAFVDVEIGQKHEWSGKWEGNIEYWPSAVKLPLQECRIVKIVTYAVSARRDSTILRCLHIMTQRIVLTPSRHHGRKQEVSVLQSKKAVLYVTERRI